MLHERVIEAMTNRPFEGLVQDAAAAHVIELAQFGLELHDVPGGPLLHDRRIETAKLRHVKQRPRALERRRRQGGATLMPQVGAQIREGAVERELSRRRIERRAFEQQPDCEVSAQASP